MSICLSLGASACLVSVCPSVPLKYLRRRNDGESVHDPVRIFLADLGNEQGTHSGPSAASEGVGELESLDTVTALCLLTDHVQHGVNELSALCVVTFGPVVAGP